MNPHEPINSWALEKDLRDGSPRILARGKDSLSGPGIIFDPSVLIFLFFNQLLPFIFLQLINGEKKISERWLIKD